MIDKRLVVSALAILSLYIVMQYLGFGIMPIRVLIDEDKGTIVKNSIAVKVNTAIAVHGPHVYIVWYDHAEKSVMLNTSNDGGNTFKRIAVTSTDNAVINGIIAEGSYINIVWTSEVNGQYDVFLSHSSDGLSFKTVNVSNNDGDSTFPAMDADGNMVYIAWIDSTYGNTEVLLRVSNDGGNTFGDTINISKSKGNSESVSIAAEGSSVYIAWHDNSYGRFGVFISVSHDYGNTFSDATMLSDPNMDSGFAAVLAEGKDVYVAWISNNGNSDDDNSNTNSLYLRVSNDGARVFNDTINVSKDVISAPLLASDGALVSLTWIDKREGIMHARIMNDGATISLTKVSIDNSASINDYKDIIKYIVVDVDGYNISMLVLLKHGSDNNNDKLYKMVYVNSRDGGSTFNNMVTIAYGSIDDISMSMKGSTVYITWGEKSCLDEQCSHVNIKYNYTKSDDLLSFKRPVNL